MENLWDIFCSKVPQFLHVVFDFLVNKKATLYILAGMQENSAFPGKVFRRSFVGGKQNKPFVSLNNEISEASQLILVLVEKASTIDI